MSTAERAPKERLPAGIHPVHFRSLPVRFRRIILTCIGDGLRLERELREAVEAIPIAAERRRVTRAIWDTFGMTPPARP